MSTFPKYLLPKLRLTGVEAANGIVRLPLRSADLIRFPLPPLDALSQALPLTDRPFVPAVQQDMASAQLALYKPITDALDVLSSTALELHTDRFGPDASRWPREAERAVYASEGEVSRAAPDSESGGGDHEGRDQEGRDHGGRDIQGDDGGAFDLRNRDDKDERVEDVGRAVAVVSFEMFPNGAQMIHDMRLLRQFLFAFPAMGASLSPSMYEQMLNSGRQAGAVPIDWLAANWQNLKSYNGQLLRSGTPLSGPLWMGAGSFADVASHFSLRGPRFAYQSAVIVSRDGGTRRVSVPVTIVAHPQFPGGVVCISMHFGNAASPPGDAIASVTAGPVFKTLFRRGALLAQAYPELVSTFGEEMASTLMLDPMVSRAFSERVEGRDIGLALDTAVISVADAARGAVQANAGVFSPPEVVTVEATRFAEVQSTAELYRMVEEGLEATRRDGYQGPGGIEAAEPGAVVSDPTRVLASGELAPVERKSQGQGQPADAAAGTLDWKAVQKAAADQVADGARMALGELDHPFSRSVDVLVELIDTKTFRDQLRERLTNALSPFLSNHLEAGASELRGEDLRRRLADAWVDPILARMTAEVDGSSYLAAAVREVVLRERSHWQAENAGAIQARILAASESIQSTNAELEARQSEIKTLNEQLKTKPEDHSLQTERETLQQQIEVLTVSLRRAETDRRVAQSEAEQDRRGSEQAVREEKEARDHAAERGRAVFHGK